MTGTGEYIGKPTSVWREIMYSNNASHHDTHGHDIF